MGDFIPCIVNRGPKIENFLFRVLKIETKLEKP